MEKFEKNGMDFKKEKLEALLELFPEAFIDGKIDFDVINQIIGNANNEEEKYSFTWPGKASAFKNALTPSENTLIPLKEKSYDFNNSENIYIEGDNLECLKVLAKTYHNKIKLIYVDPPYNTGTDMIYNDDYSCEADSYIEKSNQKFKSNPETSGRYHSDWLSMMFSRLKLSRELLTDDGCVVIAIDHNEVVNTVKICDEIFGEANRIGLVTVVHKPEGRNQEKYFASSNEFALFYCKNLSVFELEKVILDENMLDDYNLEDSKGKYKLISAIAKNHGRGGYDKNLKVNNPKNHFPIFVSPDLKDLSLEEKKDYIPVLPNTETQERTWRYIKENLLKKIEEGEIVAENVNGSIKIFEKYRIDNGQLIKTHWVDKKYNAMVYGTKVLDELMEVKTFDFPKSLYLMEDIIKLTTKSDSIILDIFSGSATTAHAIIDLNFNSGSSRKFILTQLPYPCSENTPAYQNGYKLISDIGEERIRRTILKYKKLLEDQSKKISLFDDNCHSIDLGFKVFKIDSTNLIQWDGTEKYDENSLFNLNKVIKDDRNPEDVAYEIMLKYGVFDKKLENKKINEKNVFSVDNDSMLICLEDKIEEKDINEIVKLSPTVVVFNEECFGGDDNLKQNIEYSLKRLLGEDNIKVLCL